MKNCVVIPVYKYNPNNYEIQSFIQVLKILSKYSIFLVTYKELDLKLYYKIANQNNSTFKVELFDKRFFSSLYGYNELCLSYFFYRAFAEYKYMLIYQLDAYVFFDQLEHWCHKGYDYIGAPWFEDNKSHEEGAKLWAVGNGGFSLRNVSTFINLFKSKKTAYSFKYLYKKTINEKKGIWWLFKAIVFKVENNFKYLVNEWNDAEDLFYCLKLADTKFRLNIPDIEVAIDFAFEQSPMFLYELSGNKLPFGCHAWVKYEYNSFWKSKL